MFLSGQSRYFQQKWGEDQTKDLHVPTLEPFISRSTSLESVASDYLFSLDTTQLNNLVQSLTSYRNEPAYVSPTPSTMVISSDQDFGQVYGQGDQGKF